MIELFDSRNADIRRMAVISDCQKYRYILTRDWHNDSQQAKDEAVVFIMLNPSAADSSKDDPTIRRCMQFARDWATQENPYNGIVVVNLFAYRSPDPRLLNNHTINTIGPVNDATIIKAATFRSTVVAAWGKPINPLIKKRADDVAWLLKKAGIPLHCLGLTNEGFPRHPLYVRKDAKPIVFCP